MIDRNGQDRAVVVWRCGPDILFSETMDGMFDNDRRYKAPKWLVEQLHALSPSRQFDFMGDAKMPSVGGEASSESEAPKISVSDKLPEGMEDEDLPGVQQA